MMLNANSVDHLPYLRHTSQRAKGPELSSDGLPRRDSPHGFGPLRTNGDVLRPVCDKGLYPSTDGTADGKVRVDACTKDRVVNGTERGRDVDRE